MTPAIKKCCGPPRVLCGPEARAPRPMPAPTARGELRQATASSRDSGTWTCRAALAALLLLALVCSFSPLRAGGARSSMLWPLGTPVVYNPDPGALGLLSNAQARALLAEAFDEWQATGANISFAEGAPLDEDVDAFGFAFNNPAHFRNFYRVDGERSAPTDPMQLLDMAEALLDTEPRQ